MPAINTLTRPFAALAIAATLIPPARPASADDPNPAEQLVQIEGKVLDESGQPAAGVTARLFAGEKPWESVESTAMTDGEGRYRLSVAREGLILNVEFNSRAKQVTGTRSWAQRWRMWFEVPAPGFRITIAEFGRSRAGCRRPADSAWG